MTKLKAMKTSGQKSVHDSNKRRRTHQADAEEGTGAAIKSEQEPYNQGDAASQSEQADVTSPIHRKHPVVGPGKVDFESRTHGRHTARMVGHEPGTEI